MLGLCNSGVGVLCRAGRGMPSPAEDGTARRASEPAAAFSAAAAKFLSSGDVGRASSRAVAMGLQRRGAEPSGHWSGATAASSAELGSFSRQAGQLSSIDAALQAGLHPHAQAGLPGMLELTSVSALTGCEYADGIVRTTSGRSASLKRRSSSSFTSDMRNLDIRSSNSLLHYVSSAPHTCLDIWVQHKPCDIQLNPALWLTQPSLPATT